MRVVIINKGGKIKEQQILRLDFVKKFDLNIRDLRPVFSDLQVATILPRKKVIIINLGFVKAILSKEEVFILKHNNKNTLDRFLKSFKQINYQGIKQGFFLFILERIFDAKVEQLKEKIAKIKNITEKVLTGVQVNFSEGELKKLLDLKKKVSRMEVRLNEIYQAIKEILDEDDNFSEMVSFGQNNSKKNKLEVESILENFMEQIEDNVREIFRLKEEIEDVEEYVDLKLSSKRTGIVLFDLMATVVTLVLSFLAIIVGLFGVNIENGLEDSTFAFRTLSVVLVVLFFLLLTVFLILLRRRKII
jgi:magnesium transporter